VLATHGIKDVEIGNDVRSIRGRQLTHPPSTSLTT
jgi:hypothetical protein